MTTNQTANPISDRADRKRWWQFLIPLGLQAVIIASVPAQAIYTNITGRTVQLKTVPVDPYSFLTGYSQTLSYDISNLNDLRKLPGGKSLEKHPAQGSRFYVILQADAAPEKPWKAVSISLDRPKNLPNNQVALLGRTEYAQVKYGLETYYMPEDQKDEVNKIIRETQRKNPAIVQVKVDANGNAIPISIKVSDQILKF
jgi:uncharacterized membrane-anchored protein